MGSLVLITVAIIADPRKGKDAGAAAGDMGTMGVVLSLELILFRGALPAAGGGFRDAAIEAALPA
ncbi:MAG TPA: hypothetical protein VFP65_25200 [Anaeromyxobacteraceae bacterium]|nr:hypothetical protein [Anaeromyxobacteraceae bacterium]